jgi:AcrR family transcriptional regulator
MSQSVKKSSKKRTQRPTREGPEVRRELILDEAIRVIGQRGYRGFTLQELAHLCELTNGGVLYHFRSKDVLLTAVLEEYDRREGEIIASSVELLSRSAARGGTSLHSVVQVLRVIMVRLTTQPELVRLYTFLHSEALDSAHPAYAYFTRRESMVLDKFAALVAPFCDQPRSVARQIHALMDGLWLQWLREKQSFSVIVEWDRAIARLLRESFHDQGGLRDQDQ